MQECNLNTLSVTVTGWEYRNTVSNNVYLVTFYFKMIGLTRICKRQELYMMYGLLSIFINSTDTIMLLCYIMKVIY
jgi:hypothetical protein